VHSFSPKFTLIVVCMFFSSVGQETAEICDFDENLDLRGYFTHTLSPVKAKFGMRDWPRQLKTAVKFVHCSHVHFCMTWDTAASSGMMPYK